MKRILVTGGAGYIGSHVVKALLRMDFQVRVIDDFSTGEIRRIFPGANSIEGSILNPASLREALEGVDLVIHLAAKKSVSESVKEPAQYFRVNSEGTWILLSEMEKANVKAIIFSSTAAIYDSQISEKISEDFHVRPKTPYGVSKLMGEKLIESFCDVYDFNAVILRYFNVVGAGDSHLGETSGESLFPSVFSAISRSKNPQIFGNDYNTFDGTCVRDFIHVSDIAESHLAVIEYLKNNRGFSVFNVGTGVGYSVKQVINQVINNLGISPKIDLQPRRIGDVPFSVADSKKLFNATGWKPVFGLAEMVDSGWQAANN